MNNKKSDKDFKRKIVFEFQRNANKKYKQKK